MMHRWKLSFAIVGLLPIAGLIYAQAPFGGSAGKELPHRDEKTGQILALVRSLYEELSTPHPKSTCRFAYSVEVTARGLDDSLYTSVNDVRFVGDAGHVQIESSDASLFQDSTVGVAVVASQKEIRIFPSSPATLETKRRESMNAFHDELFANSTIERHEITGEEHRLVLVPSENFRRWYGVERVAITLLAEERRLVSIHAEFAKGRSYESISIGYGRLECSEGSDEAFKASALDRVFASSGRVRSEYSDYTVIDLRSE